MKCETCGTETPETDAEIEDCVLENRHEPHTDWTRATFSRRLERERDEAREHPHAMELQSLDRALADAIRERDEAREQAERYRLVTLAQDAELARLRFTANP
jgi:hypothetical protein